MSLSASATSILKTGLMAHENWRKVKEIFADALRQTPEARPDFLDDVCRDDKTLRREVESLLASFDSAESFMESPAVGDYANDKVLTESRNFAKGQILGHYEIIRQIGIGGMGDVYLANDLELQRRVALKILHENLSWKSQAKQRLLREARAVAKLDHPNICAIYEISESDDCSFIVMQFVEGETLADILAKVQLSVEQSIDLAIQIANALEEAHAHHIIHRDIKPSNIVVNNKGQLKVLDFGLAKFIEAETDGKTTKKLSSSGAIMGTVPYMSPEQLRGKTLDTRTDIFSFGVLFYEMLSGISPFQHDSNAESISAILNDEPDWTLIPTELQPIVQKSLMKDKTERYQIAKDLITDLRNVGEISATNNNFQYQTFPHKTAKSKSSKPNYYFWKSSDDGVTPKTKQIPNRQNTKPEKLKLNYSVFFSIGFALFILIGTTVWLIWKFSNTSESHSFDSLRPVRLVSWKTGANSFYSNYSSSHDGRMIAYSSAQDGKNESIYVKQTAGGKDLRVTKDEWNNQGPIWSPDDQHIVFASFREGKSGIYLCPTLGSTATLLKIIGDGALFPRYWSKDGTTIFYEYDGNLFRLDIATQETSQITNFIPSRDQIRYFSISPNETELVYCDKKNGQPDLWLTSLKDETPHRLTNDRETEFIPSWHPDGERILYNILRDNHHQINLTDRNGRKPQQITRGDNEYEIVGIAADGTKIFYRTWENKSDIWGVKIENGEEFEVASTPEAEFWSDVSPDGKSILFQKHAAPYPLFSVSESSIIIKSLTNESIQLMLQGFNPHWLPDSRHVAFLRWQTAEQKYNLWLVNTVNGEEKQITDESIVPPGYAILPYNRAQTAESSWSPNSTKFVFISGRQKDVWLASLESAKTFNLTNNANLTYYCPLWSPDGKRIAYISQQKSNEKEQQLWKVWLREEEQTKEIFLTTESVRLLGWSASSRELFLETAAGVMKSNPLDIKLLQVSVNGENYAFGIFKNIYAKSMSLSADGKMVAYTSRQDDKDNIFIAAITDGKAKKITTNGNSNLYFGSLAWSPDGKTIFFDKQEEINTISMFENFK